MKMMGGVLLVVGTAIGGGMLALPMATAMGGFWHSLPIFLFIWLMMTIASLYLLEVSLALPDGNHLISMSREFLGFPGLMIMGFFYVLLLYSALSAYISGGADLLSEVVGIGHFHLPLVVAGFIFTLMFAAVIFSGIKKIDLLNQSLMLCKFVGFLFLVLTIYFHVKPHLWSQGSFSQTLAPMSVLAAAFAFGMIVPNLRHYFTNDVATLRRVVIIGSIIPLLAYTMWNAAVQGVVAGHGPHGLYAMAYSSHAVREMATALGRQAGNAHLHMLAKVFSSICILTSFLGVGLSLVGFFADGLRLKNPGRQKILLYIVTFVPPWLVMIFYPDAFVYSLRYAGLCSVVTMMLLPGVMVYRLRYVSKKDTASRRKVSEMVAGGKVLLLVHMALSLLVFIYVFLQLVYHPLLR